MRLSPIAWHNDSDGELRHRFIGPSLECSPKLVEPLADLPGSPWSSDGRGAQHARVMAMPVQCDTVRRASRAKYPMSFSKPSRICLELIASVATTMRRCIRPIKCPLSEGQCRNRTVRSRPTFRLSSNKRPQLVRYGSVCSCLPRVRQLPFACDRGEVWTLRLIVRFR